MARLNGGDGSQTIRGTAADDIIFGHSAADAGPASGLITATKIATGLASPVFAGSTAADPNGLYVLEKDEGRITRVDLATGAKSTFLDIPNGEFAGGDERGLLGLAFHPDYANNGRFFVFVNAPNGDLTVKEYHHGAGAPELVKTIITIPHSAYGNHNGGSLAFGPDGHLYISTGDGGGGNDPGNNAQNKDVLLGKILRLDVTSAPDAGKNYHIPQDNPFVGKTGADEVFDYGLRNPWRMSFDSATGDLWIGDVGQDRVEEVDVHRAGVAGGLNFGWKIREGNLPNIGSGSGFTEPVYTYTHATGHSITGGYVYHGSSPGLQGAYIFADFVDGHIWALKKIGGVTQVIELTARLTGSGAGIGLISSFGVDAKGELYAVSFTGDVIRLNPSAAAGDGNDVVFGGAGNDQIHGGIGNDRIAGDTGNDRLFGDTGNDSLTGGLGRDVQAGGAGTDRFIFATITEIGNAAATRDVITDLRHGQDKIDLGLVDANGAGAGNTAFAWKGAAAFSRHAGELHQRFEGAATTIIEGDVNGDGRADFQIALTGHLTLSGTDFVL